MGRTQFGLNLYRKWYDRVPKAILSLLEPRPDAKVVDLGCGDGSFTLEVQKRIGCNEVVGVDIHKPSVEKARRRGIKVIEWDLNRFPYPLEQDHFDYVISNQVLEHLFYPTRFLMEIRRILRMGGAAVLSTENLASWDNVFALLLGFTPFSALYDRPYVKLGNPLSPHDRKLMSGPPPHTRVFTYRALVELLELLGFRVDRIVGSAHLLGPIGEAFQKSRCRFITFKVRKVDWPDIGKDVNFLES